MRDISRDGFPKGRELNVFEILAIALGLLAVKIFADDKYVIVAEGGFVLACSLYGLYVTRSKTAGVLVLIVLVLALIAYVTLPPDKLGLA